MAVGRVAGTGNIGYSSNYRGGVQPLSVPYLPLSKHLLASALPDLLSVNCGRSYHGGINEEIIWISIGMAITIGILITLALIYLAYEKCQKRRNHYIHA